MCLDQVTHGQQLLDAAAADSKRAQEEKDKYISTIWFDTNRYRRKRGSSYTNQTQIGRYGFHAIINTILEEIKKLTEQNDKLKKEKAELDEKLLAIQKAQERLTYLYGYYIIVSIIGQNFIKVAALSRMLSTPSCFTSGWMKLPKPR